ncbi:beta-1,6-N-acetylglucosaminyltransferase [Pedobacter antarcticus]|uniref:beta-1,6-N-acetylglucosaminyltransferase n=1 Tax=Pedobacter antarcticus TaxID=34086 RepID=UPI001C55B524|nr:beta-1,6-N-acetylglucosaminyltransferase [Pedobacter antarcticus]
MKHAYLIIAHNQFSILQRLLSCLDDRRNDIYIHFDKKVKKIPVLKVLYSRLFVLDERADVRWADVSQIQSEFILFQAAFNNGPYAYYHTLSGVDMPLKSQNEIHDFLKSHDGKEFIGYTQGDISKEIDRKVKRYHLFSRFFRADSTYFFSLFRLLRFALLRFQYLFIIQRHRGVDFKKGTSWVSVTQTFVEFLLPHYKEVMKMYKYTFCADEIFLQTICWNSLFRDRLYDPNNEGRGSMRMIGWRNNQLVDWEDKDFDILMNSDALFARKFDTKHIEVVDRILKKITSYD